MLQPIVICHGLLQVVIRMSILKTIKTCGDVLPNNSFNTCTI